MPTIPEIDTKIDTDLPTNSVGQITASRLRGVLHYISSALGGGTVTSGAVPEATRTVMQTLSFASPPDSIRTNGFNEVGVGPALYTKAPGNTIPAHWPSSGVLTTGDGTNYLITPENGDLWVEQFGAKGRASGDLSTDQWQAFEDCKYAILLQPDTIGFGGGSGSGSGGVNMRIGRGSFYMTKSHSITGGAYWVRGSGAHNGGTQIRTPGNVDAFQVQYSFGGQPTFGHEGGNLNGFPRILGSLVYVSGQTHIYKATNTGTPNMSSPPTGTGTGITSGTATFDYVRERTWSEMLPNGGDYSKISDLVCFAVWDPAVNGYDEDQTAVDGGYHCGILFRARATAENIYCLSYAGHGLCVAGDGGSECRGGGVPNNAIVRNYRAYFNAHDGLRFDGTDANACLAEIIDTGSNKRSGVTDESLLGNRYIHLQSAFDGSPGNVGTTRYGACTYGGYHYIAQPKQLGSGRTIDYTLTPGATGSEFTWLRRDGDGTAVGGGNYPTWTNLLFFQPAGGFISNNINAENQILGLYIEGGGYAPQLGLYDIAWGGALGNGFVAENGANMYSRAVWQNRVQVNNAFSFDGTGVGRKEMRTFLGGIQRNAGKSTEAPDNTIWGYNDWEGAQYRCQLVGPSTARDWQNMDVTLTDINLPNFIYGWTGSNTTRTFGQSVTQKGMAYFPRFVLGSGSSSMADTAARVWQMTSSNLGTGTTAATGDANGKMYIYANPSAGAGDPWGWQVRGGFFWPLYP